MWRRPVQLALPPNLQVALGDLTYVPQPRALRPGHRLALLRDGAETYPAMLEAIASAERTVHLETYILADDRTGQRFADALAERARAGVTVRLLFDTFGSITLGDDYVSGLQAAGVRVAAYRPLFAWWRRRWGFRRRDHRKILVVDGRVGFTGGLNVADEYAPLDEGGGGWHDYHVRVEGPAVGDLERLFRDTWWVASGERIPAHEVPAAEVVATDGTAFAAALGNAELRRRRLIRRAYLHAIKRARETIHIANAYFIPDRGLRRALANAVRRGVEVTLIVPGLSDVRSVQYAGEHTFGRLLRVGIRVLEWPERVLHAKAAVVDGAWATIGSYNLDSQSLRHNLEAVMTIVDRSFAGRLRDELAADADRCRAVDLEAWRARPAWRRFLGWLFYQVRYWL